MNEFVVFTTMRRVFVRFLEEIEDTKKTFRNYLTFRGNEYNKRVSPKKPQKVIVELLYTYIHYTIHMHAKYA